MEQAIVSFRGDYGFLSNMFSVSVCWDGRMYRSSEAAFQSAKSLDPRERESFCVLSGAAAKMRGKKVMLRPDWEDVKVEIMEDVVRAKFSQHPELAAKLLETGDAPLLEGNDWHDTYWGVDRKTLEGENHLGIILMKIRQELGQGDFLETAERIRREREETKRREKESLENECRHLQAQLVQIPEYDFVGMEMNTKMMGRAKITAQNGHYLIVAVRGQEKKFALPGCILQGFLIPDDHSIIENLQKQEYLQKKLDEILKKKGN